MQRLLMIALFLLPVFAYVESIHAELIPAEIKLNRFNANSYQQIIKQYDGEPLLMMLWSVDCPPCIKELGTVGRFFKAFPDANVVMVSTDNELLENDIRQLLHEHNLEKIPQWVFADDSDQLIRYAIDQAWYGELPRSYFHLPNQLRRAKSGRLDESDFSAWRQEIQKSAHKATLKVTDETKLGVRQPTLSSGR